MPGGHCSHKTFKHLIDLYIGWRYLIEQFFGRLSPSDDMPARPMGIQIHGRVLTESFITLFYPPVFLSDMLPLLPRWIETSGSVTSRFRFGLPRILGGSASTTFLLKPTQGSLALRPARLLQAYRLTSVPRASVGRSPCPTVWVATGINQQFPGRNFHPLVSCAIVAHQYLLCPPY